MVRKAPLDDYVVETLLPDLVGHDRSPSSFLVYLALWGKGAAGRSAPVRMALGELTEETGLSKSAVQAGVRNLVRRRLVAATHASKTAVAEYRVLRPWRRK
jgi:DNA-binding MarR family transcriptional regulator